MDDVVLVTSPPTSATPAPAMPASATSGHDTNRTVLIIDGAYAQIGARRLEGSRVDYVKFRSVLEQLLGSRLRECWFFDHEHVPQHSARHSVAAHYTALKLAPPDGPQFQLRLYEMKKYQCYCRRCGHQFHQMVQKGVDNGIATKILSLAYENICDRFILFAGDGDFYDSLNHIKNVLRKDLWVIGYRDTVSADLQQLASHMLWADELWPKIKMPSEPSAAAAAANESDAADRHDASEDEHASRRPHKKRGRDRQVQVTSHPPPTASNASNESRHRRESHRSRHRDRVHTGAHSSHYRGGGSHAAPAGGSDTVSPRHRTAAVHHDVGGAPDGPPGRPRSDFHHVMVDDRNGDTTGPPLVRYHDTDDGTRSMSRGTQRNQNHPHGKRQRNGDPRSKPDDASERDDRARPRLEAVESAPGAGRDSKSDVGGKKSDAVSALLSFALSDISTSGDEDEKFVTPPAAKMAKITVIDLASDSETE